ncbi:unnamed protein product [Oikopleura dioica]|uniref:Uncharacterized protein n=1 Tax=Oikopleura dioica TaxID=34765 RepID=E4Z176_OIKDI|nr:unnamed protein product [Oikopleura dioica]
MNRCTETSWKTTPGSSKSTLNSVISEKTESLLQLMISLAERRLLLLFNLESHSLLKIWQQWACQPSKLTQSPRWSSRSSLT